MSNQEPKISDPAPEYAQRFLCDLPAGDLDDFIFWGEIHKTCSER